MSLRQCVPQVADLSLHMINGYKCITLDQNVTLVMLELPAKSVKRREINVQMLDGLAAVEVYNITSQVMEKVKSSFKWIWDCTLCCNQKK